MNKEIEALLVEAATEARLCVALKENDNTWVGKLVRAADMLAEEEKAEHEMGEQKGGESNPRPDFMPNFTIEPKPTDI